MSRRSRRGAATFAATSRARGPIERAEGDAGDDLAAELDRLGRPGGQHEQPVGEVLGQRVEEVERRRVGGVDVVDDEQRFGVAPAPAQRGEDGAGRRLAAGVEQLRQHRPQRVQRRGVVAPVAVQPHGLVGRARA